jgi:peptidoglycan/xylan/chitin deacetylase (PgdA/CDA1 family)
MRWQQLVTRGIGLGASCFRKLSPARTGLRVLTYHTIGGQAYEDKLNLNSISLKLFLKHIDLIERYRVVPLTPLDCSNESLKIAVTFDDGYRDNLTIAAPILVNREIPFTLFVTSQFIDKGDKLFLNPSELRELSTYPGVTVGSHGFNHIDLTKCNDSQLRSELESSKRHIEDIIGKEVTTLSYPFGLVNKRVRDAAFHAGFQVGGAGFFNINRQGQDPLLINRSVILQGDSASVLNQKINGDWDWYRLIQRDPAHSSSND